ncbi:MAG: DUF4910 domain-containing protein [Candidatus Korarchaeota archaeon]|nr:DUF4910 domain-containing protein [Candidatus Korarchaeota archaeon]
MVALLAKTVRECARLADGRRALDDAWGISLHHRIQASPGFDAAVEFARGLLEEAGLEVQVYDYPADGRAEYWGWVAPIGWEIKDAELWMEEPERELIATFSQHPTLVAAHSAPTGGWEEAELVDVGEGVSKGDYDVPVSGKIVLASGRASLVHRLAVMKRGARGTLSYSTQADPESFPYVSIWPTADELRRMGVALTVPRVWADRLRSYLSRGERVRLRFRVEAEYSERALRVLEARLPGEEDLDVLLIAHICHPRPGAHDNASGVAAAIEAARVIAQMDCAGKKLRRGFRLWLVPEFSGTIAHLASNPDLPSRLAAVLNLDMVGSDLSVTGGTLSVVGFPLYSPSFMPLLAHRALEVSLSTREYFEGHSVPWAPFTLNPYSDGSDHHVFADPKVGVPQAAYGEWPDRYYHTDGDLPANLDPRLLGAVSSAAAGLALELATSDAEGLKSLARLTAALARRHGSRELAELAESSGPTPEVRMAQVPVAYGKAVSSLTKISGEEGFAQYVRALADRVTADLAGVRREFVPDGSPPNLKLGSGSDARLRRAVPGPLPYMRLMRGLRLEDYEKYLRERKLSTVAYHLLYALSLREDLGGAYELVLAEVEVSWEDFRSVARDLITVGLVEPVSPGKRTG